MASSYNIVDEIGLGLEEILSRHGLKLADLDRECPRFVRDEIAVKIDNWEMVGRCLEFDMEKLHDIDRENRSQELCRIALLDTWGKREGKRATYLKLANVLHRRERRDLVEFLYAKLKSTFRPILPMSGNTTSWDMPFNENSQQRRMLRRPVGTITSQTGIVPCMFQSLSKL